MSKITPVDIIQGISGKFGNKSDEYFSTNSSSHNIHYAKMKNYYKGPYNEAQTAHQAKFKMWQESASTWLNTNKPTKASPEGTIRYQQVESLKKQNAMSNIRQVLFKYMDRETGEINLPDITTKVTLTISVDDSQGSTDPAAGSYVHTLGDSVTIEAEAKEDYSFVKWSNGSTDNPVTLTLTEDLSINPVFEEV